MTVKKTGGPNTAAGKEIVSKNAFKHGATATHLLTPEQKQRYESLLEALQQQYPSENPLIQLQLERIARLTVQLERLQMVMDATFQISRIKHDSIDSIMNALELDEDQMRLVSQIILEADSANPFINITHKKLEYEFYTIHNENSHINNHEALLFNAPYLCRALYEKASMMGLTIDKFLTENLKLEKENLQIENLDLEDVDLYNNSSNQKIIDQEIKDTNLRRLLNAVDYYMNIYSNSLKSKINAEKIKQLYYLEQQSVMPNADQLDKLMRYQTTLQRQLSTCIGELLALNKN